MNDKKVSVLVIVTAIILLLIGVILFFVFDKQGMTGHKTNNYINYNVNDYVEISPVIFDNYGDVYNNINVSKVNIKNIDNYIINKFVNKEEEFIEYINDYYHEISSNINYMPVSTVSSNIKTQINETVLSIFYRVDFNLDNTIFSDNFKSYITTINVDLSTNKVLTNEDLLSKYNYTKKYIVDKLFNEDVLVGKNEVVIDKNTNISLTRNDVERKKEYYVSRIISEFDNIISIYIENNSLVLVYDTKDLKNIFFDNEFNTNIKIRYLK